MARVFSLPTILRQVPKLALGQFFEQLGISFPHIDWRTLSDRDVQPILTVLYELPVAQMNIVERELRTIYDMACETGINALIETAIAHGDPQLAERMPSEQTVYAQAVWVWLHRRDYFDQAGLVVQVENLSWWRKRNDLPRQEPKLSRADLDQLRHEISRLLLAEQGRGRLCSAEVLVRGQTYYFFLYPDDFVQSVTEHDDEGNLAPRAVRRTFDIVLAYDRDQGTLELFAKVPGKLKPRIEEVFAKHILSTLLGAWEPPAAYKLNHLRLRSTQLPVDPRDGVTVTIRRLRFEVAGNSRRLELEADPDEGPRDIHDMIDEYLNRENLRMDDLRVKSATLVFEFAAIGVRKAGTTSIDIRYPASCNLWSHRPERVEIIENYLRQWGIDVRSDHSQPAAPSRESVAAVA